MAIEHVEQGFTQVPNWVLMHPDLGRVDLAVYLVLAYHADHKTWECWPSRRLIMAEARLGGIRHLKTSLRRLSEVGAIEVVKRPGYPNLYRLPRLPKATDPGEGGPDPGERGPDPSADL